MKPRWKRCVESTDALLGEALGRKYVEKYFPPEAKARMQEMVKNLRLAMGETIEGLGLDDAADQEAGAGEARHVQSQDRLPDKWKDYSKVEIAATPSGTERRRPASACRTITAQIGKPIDRGRWGLTPPTSNAYYNPTLNEIVFPAGILQPPAFSM